MGEHRNPTHLGPRFIAIPPTSAPDSSQSQWSTCTGEILPTAEICDGLDNSCDGTVDGFDEACYTGPAGTRGVGICTDGLRTCTIGS